MQKFTFTNSEKTEIRHNLVPEFLIEVIKLDAPGDYQSAGLSFIDLFDEISIRGHHFVFLMEDGEYLDSEDDAEAIYLYRSICKRAAKWYKAQVISGFIPLEKFEFAPGPFEDEEFKLMESDEENHWLVAHKASNFIIEFEQGKFNETQKVSQLSEFNPENVLALAGIMREISEWLSKNHRNLI